MAERIVNGFKMIQIDKHNADALLLAAGFHQRLARAILQQITIGQIGQAVVIGKMVYTRFSRLALGDIAHRADKQVFTRNFTSPTLNSAGNVVPSRRRPTISRRLPITVV